MGMWLAVQPPGVLLLLGAFVTLTALGVALTTIRFLRYWQWSRSADQRQRDFMIVAVAATLAAGAAATVQAPHPDDLDLVGTYHGSGFGYDD